MNPTGLQITGAPSLAAIANLGKSLNTPTNPSAPAPKVGGAELADGSISQTGNTPLSSTALNVAQPTGQDFTVPKNTSVPSTSLVGGSTMSDLLKKRSSLEQAAITANTPTDVERDLTKQLNDTKQLSRQASLALTRETERLQTQSGVSQEISNNFVSDTARRYARTIGDLGVGASGLADQLNAEIAKRTANVNAAQGQLTADKDTIGLLSDLQKLTQPNVIGSPNVNQATGEVTVFTQNPQTGSITSNAVGNVGTTKTYLQTGTYVDPRTQGTVFYGVTPAGVIDTHILSGGGTGGLPLGTPGTQPAGKPDYQVAAYANRAVASDGVINKVGDQFADPKNFFTNKFPNFLKPTEKQQFEQAQKDFVNAVLRRESGAAIADSEFENARQQYFPQPGDKPEVIAQKAVNRASALNGLIGSSGAAYNGTFLDPNSRNVATAPAVSNGVDLSKFFKN